MVRDVGLFFLFFLGRRWHAIPVCMENTFAGYIVRITETRLVYFGKRGRGYGGEFH